MCNFDLDSLLFLTCSLSCARTFDGVSDGDFFASYSTLFVGYEFDSDATYLVMRLLHVPLYLWDTS